MYARILIFCLLCLMLESCQNNSSEGESLSRRPVTLPGGQVIQAEFLTKRDDMMRGMMFRTSLPENRGLLFFHGRSAKVPYWMHNVRVPLDILWLDKDRVIVEMSQNTPPCKEDDPVKCPTFGGKEESMYVLELAGGLCDKYGVKTGQKLTF